MKIIEITVQGAAAYNATIRRQERFIEVRLVGPLGAEKRMADAGNQDDQYEAARWMQRILDGGRGTNSMINDYYRLIQQLAD